MSEFKGTKGEWKISQEFDDKYNQPVFELRSKGISGICTIWSGQYKGQEIDEQYKANAKLIACAPEMLEMLSKISIFITENKDKNYMINLLHRQVPEIEQLIKKATK